MRTKTFNTPMQKRPNANQADQLPESTVENGNAEIVVTTKSRRDICISKKVFCALFEASHLWHKKGYLEAIQNNKISLSTLKTLCREAEIPYALFFAPIKTVLSEIQKRNDILFQGVQTSVLSISSRGDVDIRDVWLIIKDIQKRQQYMRKTIPNTNRNILISQHSSGNATQDALTILKSLNLDMDAFRSQRKKEGSFDYLINVLEKNNFLISRSSPGVMPQNIFKELSFSGFAVKDNIYPSIFLYSKDGNDTDEPAGRRIFSIFLILASILNGKFTIVSLDQDFNAKTNISSTLEYQIAEEILMPKHLVKSIDPNLSSIDSIDNISDYFRVTPSMATVRLTKLGYLTQSQSSQYLNEIRERWERKSQHEHKYNKSSSATKILKYNGKLFSQTILNQVRLKNLSEGDASRLLTTRKNYWNVISALGEKL